MQVRVQRTVKNESSSLAIVEFFTVTLRLKLRLGWPLEVFYIFDFNEEI